MTQTITPDLYGDLVDVASRPDFGEWLGMVRATGGCSQPVHLWGESHTIHHPTGEILTARAPGRLLVACGNRRRTRCPSCSETYRADTFQLIKAGLVGGKAVPDIVTGHAKVFATFTAPSFGPVHHHVTDDRGKRKRCRPHGPGRCHLRHGPDDPELGQPLDPRSYDYSAAVIWNALSTRLWARTVQLVNRQAARLLGIPQRLWPDRGRVSVAKVAEYQARGVVHFHAIFRLDGPEPNIQPPSGATVELLSDAICHAAKMAAIAPPPSEALGDLEPIQWGDQIDLSPITDDAGLTTLTDGQVAGYLAKYATKGAEASGTIDHPIACRACAGRGRDSEGGAACGACHGTGARTHTRQPCVTPHAQAMIDTCWRLGGLPELEHLRLRAWAHMLGFRGHFSTKSRRYSTTLGCLRSARQTWRTAHTLSAHGLDLATPVVHIHAQELEEFDRMTIDDTVLVVGHWQYAGRGYTTGEAIYAATVAQDWAENRRMARLSAGPEWWEAA